MKTSSIDPEPPKVVGHLYAEASEGVTVWRKLGSLYDYVLAGNGVFLRAQRPEFRVQFQIGSCEVRGLPDLEEIFDWNLPLVEEPSVRGILIRARQEAIGDREMLFHLLAPEVIKHPEDESPFDWWEVIIPTQEATRTKCRPLDSGPDSSHAHALIELHSHHHMVAEFSPMDDEDEQGFRIYAVIGRLMTGPEIRVRVGVHGYFWEIPAKWVFEMPADLTDLNQTEDSDG